MAQLFSLGIIDTLMKTILTFVLTSLLLAGCSRHDAMIQSNLTGTWTHDWGQGIHSTSVIASDGDYQCEIFGLTNGRVVRLEGTMIVKHGVLIDTVTTDSQTNAQTPRVQQLLIDHMNNHEFVLSSPNLTTKAIFEKVER
jgi:hypothetical protein